MLKPWSISTAVRNPDRLRGFLFVLADMEGEEWDHAAQIEFQIRLIQARLYGAGNAQFYSGLSKKHVDLIKSGKEISYTQARNIFVSKNYKDPAMRGRQSIKALERFGFASKSNKVRITKSGKLLLAESKDYGEIFLRSLLKWQLPNPLDRGFKKQSGYDIKPFAGVLRLIDAVNKLSAEQNNKEKGLSLDEFKIFALTLINWRHIDKTAREIIKFRFDMAALPSNERDSFIKASARRLRPDFNMKNVGDYADNVVRYFRITKYVRLRGWGSHIDLEPARINELRALFKNDNAATIGDFSKLGGSYANYLASDTMPDLPGKSIPELKEIIQFIQSEINNDFGLKEKVVIEGLSHSQLMKLCDKLRNQYQEHLRNKNKSEIRNPDEAAKCIEELRSLAWPNRQDKKRHQEMRPPIRLEWFVTRALDILNDAQKISPNYPVGDDGVPTHTAPGGMADIECYYDKFAAICEVTLSRNSHQWVQETQPIMRHLHEFGKNDKNKGKEVYCLFIAPNMHSDCLNTFKISVKYGHEGQKQRIVPLSIMEFCDVLDFCIDRMRHKKDIKSASIKALFDSLADSVGEIQSTEDWRNNVPTLIDAWKRAS